MRLLLVDGHYYAYRAFYSMAGLTAPDGSPTGAIYGFAKAVRRMLHELRPDTAAICFDAGIPERRLTLQPQYKANRAETPPDLEAQIPEIVALCPKLGFRTLSIPGQEADDLIATAAIAAKPETDVVIATNDKDLMQLVCPKVTIYRPGKSLGQFDLLGEKEVEEKWGVAPDRLGDLLALLGDTSDNIPGVPGVGEKTAAALLKKFGSIDQILARVSEVEPARIRASIQASHIQILANREMVRLDKTVDIPGPWREWTVKPAYEELLDSLRRFGFKSLTREVEDEAAQTGVRPKAAWTQGELFA